MTALSAAVFPVPHRMCVGYVYVLSHVRLFVTPWTVARQASLSMEFSRQEYWGELPFSSPGIEFVSPALAGGLFTTPPLGKPAAQSRYSANEAEQMNKRMHKRPSWSLTTKNKRGPIRSSRTPPGWVKWKVMPSRGVGTSLPRDKWPFKSHSWGSTQIDRNMLILLRH